jgi:hypothetical protein
MLCLLFSLLLFSGALAAKSRFPIRVEIKGELDSSLTNIHLSYERDLGIHHFFTYGPCESMHPQDAYHRVGQCSNSRADRLIWVIPDDAMSDGCVAAWTEDSVLLGRSQLMKFLKTKREHWAGLWKRHLPGVPMTNESGIDAEGPWFDGVALVKGKNPEALEAKEIKSKS